MTDNPTFDEAAAFEFDAAAMEHGWQLDVENAIFTASSGKTFQLRRPNGITSLVLERVKQQGKPRVPMVEVTIGGKYKQLEANPNDAGYKALLEEWEAESGLRTMRYIFVTGIEEDVPPEFAQEKGEFFPDATGTDFKYLWIVSHLSDEDTEGLTEAILSMSIPTARGLKDAANSFRHNGKRASG